MTETITPPLAPPTPLESQKAGKKASKRGRVTADADEKWYQREFFLGRTVKAEDVMNFSRQAASFMRAGIPILDSLAIVAEESTAKELKKVLNDIQQRLRAGSSFGDAIAMHTRVFPGYYIAVIRASELTGQLDDAFEQLAAYMQRDINARRQVKSSLTYPTFVFALAIVAVIVMAVYVLPKFKGFYRSLGAHLPLPTRMLLAFTDFMANYWLVIVAVLGILVAGGIAVLGGSHGKRRRDTLLLKVPAIGPLLQLIAIERFCRVLAALVHAGVSLPDAVQVSAESTNQTVFIERLAIAREAMIRGEGLARPIAATGLFPAAGRQMIRVGESTGSLDEQLQTAATFYERELEYRLKRVTDLFEPTVIVVVGGAVAFVALAQVSAMYSIYSQVGKKDHVTQKPAVTRSAPKSTSSGTGAGNPRGGVQPGRQSNP
ncbi:MAG: type II secretion system F family protein [Acidimicrobiia bacterium]